MDMSKQGVVRYKFALYGGTKILFDDKLTTHGHVVTGCDHLGEKFAQFFFGQKILFDDKLTTHDHVKPGCGQIWDKFALFGGTKFFFDDKLTTLYTPHAAHMDMYSQGVVRYEIIFCTFGGKRLLHMLYHNFLAPQGALGGEVF